MYSVKQAAELCGISIRTLHYYDEIGLLVPIKDPENGYRIYSEEDILTLQQILFFREMEFSLKEIADILRRPDYDRGWILMRQKNLIIKKRDHCNAVIDLIDELLEDEMEHKSGDMNCDKEIYAKEAHERWGNTDAYREYEAKQRDKSEDKNEEIVRKAEIIFADFASLRGTDPADQRVQNLVLRWQEYLSEHYYQCTNEILAGLGQMYVADERFTKYLERFGEGTAAFISKAIEIYCK